MHTITPRIVEKILGHPATLIDLPSLLALQPSVFQPTAPVNTTDLSLVSTQPKLCSDILERR